jgi:hypothetical protein
VVVLARAAEQDCTAALACGACAHTLAGKVSACVILLLLLL